VAQLQPASDESGWLLDRSAPEWAASSINHGTPTMNTPTNPLNTYLARTNAIHAKLAQLQQLTNNHFGYDPDAVHWGHVGGLGRVTLPVATGCSFAVSRH
jgi:hypothetical protein